METTEERNTRVMECYEDIKRIAHSAFKRNVKLCSTAHIEAEDIIQHLVEFVIKKPSLHTGHKTLLKWLRVEAQDFLMNQRNLASTALYVVDPAGEHWAFTQEEVVDLLSNTPWDQLPNSIQEALADPAMKPQFRESLILRYSYGVISNSRCCKQCNAEKSRTVEAKKRLMEILNVKLASPKKGLQNERYQRCTTNVSAGDHSGDAPHDLRDDSDIYVFPVTITRVSK